jgi:hypothetical protein
MDCRVKPGNDTTWGPVVVIIDSHVKQPALARVVSTSIQA